MKAEFPLELDGNEKRRVKVAIDDGIHELSDVRSKGYHQRWNPLKMEVLSDGNGHFKVEQRKNDGNLRME